MYPSIKYKFVRRAIKYFASDLNAETQGRNETCLKMIKFGIEKYSTYICRQILLYGGDLEIENRGLTIGGYESAWLADLCMAYVMDNSRDILDDLIYDGIYREEGIAVFKGSKTTGDRRL
jgi:hypothetical protein